MPLWNEFFYPLVLLRTTRSTRCRSACAVLRRVPDRLVAVFAGLVITTAPLIIVFLLATRQIIAGLTAGIGKL